MNAKKAKQLRRLTREIVQIAEDIKKIKIDEVSYSVNEKSGITINENSVRGSYRAAKKDARQLELQKK